MAVILTDAGPYGLFNRLGLLGGLLNDTNTSRAAIALTIATEVLPYWEGTGNSAATKNTVIGLLPAGYAAQSSLSPYVSAIRTAALNTLIEMFDADAPLPKKDAQHALLALRKQMFTATTSRFEANSPTATYTGTSLTGTGNVVTCVKDGYGYTLENILAERLRMRVNQGTQTAGAERIQVLGEQAITDKLSHLWPAGSGSDATYTSLSPGGTADELDGDGDFNTFTVANTPDGWSIITGAAGADILSEASTKYAGANGLEILGDGSTLSQIRRAVTLEAQTNYAINFYCRMSTNPAAGVLTIDLYDGSGVINDEAGTANSFTVDLTTLGTTFVAKSGTFRLPDPVPTTVYLRVRLSTAITNTHSLFIDHMAMQEATQPDRTNLGATPYLAVFSGATNWSVDDGAFDGTTTFKVETLNGRTSLWQELMDKFFDTSKLGITFPTSGTDLIDDALIT